MMKKSIKLLSALGLASVLGAGYAAADAGPMGPCAMFAAKGCDTQRITIGGHIAAAYQWVDVKDKASNASDPSEYNNFYMKHIRLFVAAELGCGWSGLMNIDFAGASGRTQTFTPGTVLAGVSTLESSCECRDQCRIYVDRAYIQKVWCDTSFRLGYQKVSFGVEENTPDAYLKTINRSVASNFFTNLGHRAFPIPTVIVNDAPFCGANVAGLPFGGNRFGGRHVGLYAAGEICDFHWNAAVVNGYQGLCRNSTPFSNDLGFYAGIAYEFGFDCVDMLIGINAGYQKDGATITDPDITSGSARKVYGFNPYLMLNFNCFSLLAEFMWAHVDRGKITSLNSDGDPHGFTILPTYMINDCWELVGRFSYVNSENMGLTINETFGCVPNNGRVTPVPGGASTPSFIGDRVIFDKAYAYYLGVNYYPMGCLNQAVKASLGVEQVEYKNRFQCSPVVGQFGTFTGPKARVTAVRAQLQLLF